MVEKLTLALGLETAAIARLQAGIELRERESDNGSRQLLENILVAKRSTPTGWRRSSSWSGSWASRSTCRSRFATTDPRAGPGDTTSVSCAA